MTVVKSKNSPDDEAERDSKASSAAKLSIQSANKVAIFTGILVVFAVLAFCYVAADIILPICLAFILNLFFRPMFRGMRRLRIPRILAALIIIVALLTGVAGLGTALSGPATEWGDKLPSALPKLQERLQFLIRPVTTIQKTVNQAENVTTGKDAHTVNVAVKGEGLSDRLFSSTRIFISEIFEALLVLFFFLIAGDTFQQRFLEILPSVKDKKKALEISEQIESDISAYLRTITFMNLLVGCATCLIMYFCKIPDPILWGAIAFLFNFVPILGPLAAAGIFILVGLLSSNSVGMAFLPAALFFAVHIIEGEAATPLILSSRFTLNPALVMLALIFWFWMWGVAGAILATPMLAILKIICDRTARLKALGHLIEG